MFLLCRRSRGDGWGGGGGRSRRRKKRSKSSSEGVVPASPTAYLRGAALLTLFELCVKEVSWG